MTRKLTPLFAKIGQGKLGYVTGDEPLGARWETKGWTFDEVNDLTFDGDGFLACPNSIDGAWSIWIGTGVSNPGGYEGCLGLSARALVSTDPATCTYTQ